MTEPLPVQVHEDPKLKKIIVSFFLGSKFGIVTIKIPTDRGKFLRENLLVKDNFLSLYEPSLIKDRPVAIPRPIAEIKYSSVSPWLNIRPKRKITRREPRPVYIYVDPNPEKWISYLFLGLRLGIGSAETLLKFCQAFRYEPRKDWDSWKSIRRMLGLGRVDVNQNFLYNPRVNSSAHPITLESGDVLFRSVIK